LNLLEIIILDFFLFDFHEIILNCISVRCDEWLDGLRDEREVLPPNADVTGTAAGTAAAPHGIEVTV
jgi:hypothetical protein